MENDSVDNMFVFLNDIFDNVRNMAKQRRTISKLGPEKFL